MLCIEYVKQCFREEDGKLYWLQRPRSHFKTDKSQKIFNTRFSGKEAGYLNDRKDGPRWLICLDGKMHLRYQIVWLLHKCYWPEELDHKNRNSVDDTIGNLRIANQSQNTANSGLSKASTSGYKGVHYRRKTKKWRAHIKVNYKVIYLGQYSTKKQAHDAYVEASKKYFGEFSCPG